MVSLQWFGVTLGVRTLGSGNVFTDFELIFTLPGNAIMSKVVMCPHLLTCFSVLFCCSVYYAAAILLSVFDSLTSHV